MKPIYVGLVAIASAVVGGIIGVLMGGVAGGVAGGAGGGSLGLQAGVCATAEAAKAQKVLTPAQIDQLTTQSYAQIRNLVDNKDLVPASKPDCQAVFTNVKALGK